MDRETFVGKQAPLLLAVLTGLVAATIANAPSACAAATTQCVTARVGTPFRLPDGLLYPAGALTLCESRTFSPVDNLHRILVGGSSVGLFVSRRRNAETRAHDSSEFLFKRDADGNLELVGYTVPKSGRTVAYRLKSLGVTWQASSTRPLGGGGTAPVAAIVATGQNPLTAPGN